MFEIRPVKPGEVDQTLAVLLHDASLDVAQIADKVESFRRIAQQEHYDLTRQIVVLRDNKIIYTCLMVLNAGRTAFVFSADADESDPGKYEHAIRALRRLCQWAFQQGSDLLEVLVDTTDTNRRGVCLRCGFKRLTDLLYLSRPCYLPIEDYTPPENVNWLPYDQKQHDLFKKAISESYQGSLDCPELENLREIEDVICSHKTAGRFDPCWWKLLLWDNNPAGVLLLAPSRTNDFMELIYMGLAPAMRAKGLGKVLLNEALSCARQSGVESLLLAVDHRNHPACQLYKNFGFAEVLRRTVLYYSSHWQAVIRTKKPRIIEKQDRRKPAARSKLLGF